VGGGSSVWCVGGWVCGVVGWLCVGVLPRTYTLQYIG